MLPPKHALISFIVAIFYSLLVKVTLSDLVVFIIIGVVAGVLIDVDHVLWALLLNPNRTVKLLGSLNVREFIKEFFTTSGYFYNKIIYRKHKFLALHGLWIVFVCMLSLIILQEIGLGYTRNLVFLVLLVHYICDLSAYL